MQMEELKYSKEERKMPVKKRFVKKIARCREIESLINGKIIRKMVTYDDDGEQLSCTPIIDDASCPVNKRHYTVKNQFHKFGLFTDLPKDAYDHVKYGAGDAIVISVVLGSPVCKVIRYVDREFGEETRKKTIEGWKNTNFKWAMRFYWENSTNTGFIICKDKSREDLIGVFKDRDDITPVAFNTEEEVEYAIAHINDEAEKMANRFRKQIYNNRRRYSTNEEIEAATLRFYADYIFNDQKGIRTETDENGKIKIVCPNDVYDAISNSAIICMADRFYNKKYNDNETSENSICHIKPVQIVI